MSMQTLPVIRNQTSVANIHEPNRDLKAEIKRKRANYTGQGGSTSTSLFKQNRNGSQKQVNLLRKKNENHNQSL